MIDDEWLIQILPGSARCFAELEISSRGNSKINHAPGRNRNTGYIKQIGFSLALLHGVCRYAQDRPAEY